MRAYFDSRDLHFKSPFGAVKTGTEITFRIKVYEAIKGMRAYLILWNDGEKLGQFEMEQETSGDGDTYIVKVKAPNTPSLLWYHFMFENFEEKYFYSNNQCQYGGVGFLTDYNPISYQQTVYKLDKTQSPIKNGVVYQIFPDRFYRGSDYEMRKENTIKENKNKNHGKVFIDDWDKVPRYDRKEDGKVYDYDFYGGTLKGIEEKLPYLKELGVTAIYLNPIFKARSNHRYDIGDYMQIDSMLGDIDSFKELIKASDKKGIKIILDGVFNHQGADSKYFNKYGNYKDLGAYNSKDSKYFSWYEFLEYPNSYKSWWGVDDLPSADKKNESYIDFICRDEDSVIKHYMNMGIAGFRLDVADELTDNFISEIRKAMDAVDKKNILIGEVWEDASNKVSYDENRKYFLNASLKSVTNYPFMKEGIAFMKGNCSASDLYEFFYHQMENYPPMYFNNLLNVLDSHDRVRIIMELADQPDESELNDEEKYTYIINDDKYMLATSRLKALSVLQYTIPGVPLLYYGDEAGVYGYDDPYNRKTYPWGKENIGLIEHYKMLGKLRSNNKIFADGDFKPIIKGVHTFGFERKYKDEKVIVLINRGIFYNEGENIELDVDADNYIDMITEESFEIKNNKLSIYIEPLGYRVIKL